MHRVPTPNKDYNAFSRHETSFEYAPRDFPECSTHESRYGTMCMALPSIIKEGIYEGGE